MRWDRMPKVCAPTPPPRSLSMPRAAGQHEHIMQPGHSTRTLWRCQDGPVHSPVDCGTPQRRELDGKPIRHGQSWNRAQYLCRGMRMIQQASCAQLGNTTFLREAIQYTGITYDARKTGLYGEAAKYMIRTSTGQKIGLWQDPSQFAAAMAYHGSSRHEITSYVEVGCYTGWTALILATYLQRVGHALRGIIIDLKEHQIGPVAPLLAGRNLTFMLRSDIPNDKMALVPGRAAGRRGNAPAPPAAAARAARPVLAAHCVGHAPFSSPQHAGPARAFDLCFIDAQHSYAGVLEDYGEFAPHCRSAMFHDIQDMSTWHLGNWSGGVPAFWAGLAQHSTPGRLTSITFQISTAQPVFGLGILRPGANGSAEPDTPTAEWPWPSWRSKKGLTSHFCGQPSPPPNFQRACSMLDRAKY